MITELCILLTIHFISDFVMQSREVAEKKSTNIRYMIKHFIYIFLSFLITLMILSNIKVAFLFSLTYATVHCIQDRYIWSLYRRFRRKKFAPGFEYWKDGLFYDTIGLDQLLHTITIVCLWRLLL